jgi:hypothetical protein
MRGKGNLNLIKRLEKLEKVLEVNEIHVYYDSETIPERPGATLIRLKWLDLPEVRLFENLSKAEEER